MSFPRGAVVLVAYPNSDRRSFKKRPALVVQAEHVVTGLAQTVLALITSNLNRTGPTRVRVHGFGRVDALGLCRLGYTQ